MSWFRKQKKVKTPFTPSLPLTWWIDDLSHRVCGLADDPEFGLSKLPWPDCDKVYLAVNKEDYDKLEQKLSETEKALYQSNKERADFEKKLSDSEADWIKMRDIAKETQRKLDEAIEVIRFYAEGSNNMDYWKHEKLGYFRGKRARDFLAKINNNQLNDTK